MTRWVNQNFPKFTQCRAGLTKRGLNTRQSCQKFNKLHQPKSFWYHHFQSSYPSQRLYRMVLSRRGSGSVTLPTGQTLAMHTRTQDEEVLPHATKKWVNMPPATAIACLDVNRTSGPWPIIWGNTKACQYTVCVIRWSSAPDKWTLADLR